MKMTKRSQALSLNTVIIAALVVLVLIVLSFIVIRYMGDWSGDLGNCALQQGICSDSGACGEPYSKTANYPIARPDLDCGDGKVCCVRLTSSS